MSKLSKPYPSDNRVLTFTEWCALNGISERTGRRIIAGGGGPSVIQLSPQRIGISTQANLEWQAKRTRKSAA